METVADNLPRGIGDNQPPVDQVAEEVSHRLSRDYAATEDTAAVLLAKARVLPMSVSSDVDVEKFTLVVRELRDHDQRIEAIRKTEKEPYLRGGQAVDGFFSSIRERLGKASRVLHIRVDAYQQEKLEREQRRRREEEARAFAEAMKLEEQARRAKSEARKTELEIEAKMAAGRAAMAEHNANATPAQIARTRFESGAMATMAQANTAKVIDYDRVPLDKLRPYFSRDTIDKAVRAWAKATSYQETMGGVLVEHGSKTVLR